MDEHSKNYQILRNRLTNGEEFVTASALEMIAHERDNLRLTVAESEELEALAKANGVDILSADIESRVQNNQSRIEDIEIMLTEMYQI